MTSPPSVTHPPDPQDPGTVAPPSSAARIGRYTLWLALLGLLLWAALAPIDEGIPATGVVAVDTKRKPVQHLQGGIVREVFVQEGAAVREGDVLMVLEQATARANFESIRQHYLALRSAESRLLAEQAGKAVLSFHPDLESQRSDPMVRQHIQTQQELFKSRRLSLQANLASLQENQAGLQEQRKRQQALLEEELVGLRELVREGYAPRNRQLELERNLAEVRSALADASASLQRVDRQVAEVGQRMQVVQQDYRKEVDAQLAEIRREVQADAEKLKAVTQDLARTELRAPAAGQVVGLAVQAVGAVIGAGQKIMDIVPAGAPLLIEARVSPHVVDRLREGLPTEIRFSAFAHAPQLNVPGRVVSVSRDLLTDPDTRQPYFLARVEILPEARQALGGHEVQAGMTADVLVKTGERSFLTYLTYPLVRRVAQSMKEH